MDFCNFYGISLTQLLTQGVDNDTLSNLAGYLNNSFDKEKLVNFKKELESFVDFFSRIENKEIMEMVEYTPEDKNKNKMISTRTELLDLHEQRVKSSRRKSTRVKRTDRFLDKTSPNSDIDSKHILTDEHLRLLKQFIKYQNVLITPKKSRINPNLEIVSIVNLDGNLETLNDLEISIAQYFGQRIRIRKHLVDGLDVNAVNDAVIFNMTVSAIIASSGERLLNYLFTSFKNKTDTHNSSFYYDVYDNVMRLNSLVTDNVRPNQVKEESKEILYEKSAEGAEHREFIENLRIINPNFYNNPKPLYYISQLYESVKDINVDSYNSIFRIDKTKDEYEKAFTHLAELGLVGLNFNPIAMMETEIKGLTLEKDDQITVDPNSECAYNFNIAARFMDTIILKEGDSL